MGGAPMGLGKNINDINEVGCDKMAWYQTKKKGDKADGTCDCIAKRRDPENGTGDDGELMSRRMGPLKSTAGVVPKTGCINQVREGLGVVGQLRERSDQTKVGLRKLKT